MQHALAAHDADYAVGMIYLCIYGHIKLISYTVHVTLISLHKSK